MAVAVFAIESDSKTAGGFSCSEYFVQASQDFFECDRPRQCEVEVFGKSVVLEPAAAQRGAAFEREHVAQRMAGQTVRNQAST